MSPLDLVRRRRPTGTTAPPAAPAAPEATIAERVVARTAGILSGGHSRRRFLTRTAVVGSALAVNPTSFILKPGTAYGAVCGTCGDGWTAFCCTINSGRNSCPPNTFVAGWWKADNAAYCCGGARYIIDCNATCPTQCACRCAGAACDGRRTCCNQFRYGQCNQQISCYGPVACRVAICITPWAYDAACSTLALTDNRTVEHGAACLSAECDSAITRRYYALGGPDGFLGIRAQAEQDTPGGRYAIYNGGRIYWSPATGAREIHGSIFSVWAQSGATSGPFGFPTTDVTGDSRVRYSTFQGGGIYSWAQGTFGVQGALQRQVPPGRRGVPHLRPRPPHLRHRRHGRWSGPVPGLRAGPHLRPGLPGRGDPRRHLRQAPAAGRGDRAAGPHPDRRRHRRPGPGQHPRGRRHLLHRHHRGPRGVGRAARRLPGLRRTDLRRRVPDQRPGRRRRRAGHHLHHRDGPGLGHRRPPGRGSSRPDPLAVPVPGRSRRLARLPRRRLPAAERRHLPPGLRAGIHRRRPARRAPFVKAAYTDFLDRLPTRTELEQTNAALATGGTTRDRVVRDLARSPEYVSTLVEQLYVDTLGRPGDGPGTSFWTEEIRSGRRTVAQVAASFYASPEYYGGIGGGTDRSWVADLYQKVLGRAASPSDLDYWAAETASRGRGNVALRLYQSLETRRTRVDALYQALLGRRPSPRAATTGPSGSPPRATSPWPSTWPRCRSTTTGPRSASPADRVGSARRRIRSRADLQALGSALHAGVAQWLEPLPSKQAMRVRFPSPAPREGAQVTGTFRGLGLVRLGQVRAVGHASIAPGARLWWDHQPWSDRTPTEETT